MRAYLTGFAIAVFFGSLVGMHATGRGLLVESEFVERPWKENSSALSCRYLVGFEILVQEMRYDPRGFRGVEACPGMQQFDTEQRERLRKQRELRQRERRARSLF